MNLPNTIGEFDCLKGCQRTANEDGTEEQAAHEIPECHCQWENLEKAIHTSDAAQVRTDEPVERETPPRNGALEDRDRMDLGRGYVSIHVFSRLESRPLTIMLLVRSS